MRKWHDEDDADDYGPDRGARRPRSKRGRIGQEAEAFVAPLPARQPSPQAPAVAPVIAIATETGTVRFFDAERGFGFVQPQRAGSDLFVHITAIRRAGLEQLTQGQTIEFERGPGRQPGKDAVARIITGR